MSDENKRRNYDGQGGHTGSFKFNEGTKANNFDFNFDDLFKQFEHDIFGDMKGHMHTHFGSHFAAHHHATGGAFSFEDMFDNDDFFKDFGMRGEANVHKRSVKSSHKQHCHTVTKPNSHTSKQSQSDRVTMSYSVPYDEEAAMHSSPVDNI